MEIAREQFWPMVEEDFGNLTIESARNSDDPFEDFWCINVENLKQKSLEICEEVKKNNN